MLLSIGGLVIGATTYLKQQAQARDAQHQAQIKSKIEKQNQKEGLIGNLRDRIAEISKRVQAVNKQSLKGKREAWSESLNKLSLRLDGISNISSEQYQEINQACDEIGKELSKIEEEVNNVQGLFPSTVINREPIKV
jgi:chromosome segregation ATPase